LYSSSSHSTSLTSESVKESPNLVGARPPLAELRQPPQSNFSQPSYRLLSPSISATQKPIVRESSGMRILSSLKSAFSNNASDCPSSPSRSPRSGIADIHSRNRMVSLFLSSRR